MADLTIPAYIWLYSPVPIKVLESWMLVEETAVPPTHVAIADHPSFSDTYGAEIFQTVHESALVNPIR